MAARERRYNPGVVTAMTLLLPHALAGGWWLTRSGRAGIATLAAAAAGLGSGVLLPPLLKRRARKQRRAR
jgi:hypothetical protein